MTDITNPWDLVLRHHTLLDLLENILKGSDINTVTIDGEVRPVIAKDIKDKYDAFKDSVAAFLSENGTTFDEFMNGSNTSFSDFMSSSNLSFTDFMGQADTDVATTIAQVIADINSKWAAIQALVDSSLVFETKAQLDAYVPALNSNGQYPVAKVWRDNEINNGMYGYSNSAWTKSEYDAIQFTKDTLATSIKDAAIRPSLIPIVIDKSGNVALWLDDGKLSASGVSKSLSSLVGNDLGIGSFPVLNHFVPIITDADGQVLLWLEDGQLAFSGLSARNSQALPETMGIYNRFEAVRNFLPLYIDESGNVPIWLHNGLLSATGLSKKLMDQIKSQLSSRNYSEKFTQPLNTDGRTLWRLRAKLAQLEYGDITRPRMMLTGDSWTQLTELSQGLADALYTQYGFGGDGWVSIGEQVWLNGITRTQVGIWSLYDASNGSEPAHGCGVDGQSRTHTGSDGRLIYWNVKASDIELFYQDLDGSFEYRAYYGGDWVRIDGQGTDSVKSVKLTGLIPTATEANQIYEIRAASDNVGTICLHGLIFTNESQSGFIVDKAGNSGSTAKHLNLFNPFMDTYLTKINPDCVVIILGTNDSAVSFDDIEYIDALTNLVATLRHIDPTIGIIFVFPANTSMSHRVPLSVLRTAMYELALKLNCEFYSLLDDFGTFEQMNALGMFKDGAHLSERGSILFANRFLSLFGIK